MSAAAPTFDPAKQRAKPLRTGRVTITDLASSLGLTKGTVSRALNNYPDISEATRLRVQRAAERLGYRPLSHAQAIRTGRVRSLGLVLQIDEHDAHAPFLKDFLAGVTQAATELGWTLAVATAQSDTHMQETLGRLIDEHKADGFILPRSRVRDPRVEFLQGRGVPFILYGRSGFGIEGHTDRTSWFDISGEAAMQDAVMRLHGFGHCRIGFVGAGIEYNYSHLRAQGYRAGLKACGLDHAPELERKNIRLSKDGAAATEALLRLPNPPTAIVFSTDEAAMGAYTACEKLGILLGEDLSIIAYDGIPEGQFARPGLTTFSVDSRRAGERLAHMLISQIREDAPAESLRELAPANLVPRQSDGPPRRTPSELAAHLAALTS